MSETSETEARHRLIVGVDFGTAFTGISFAMTHESQTVYPIKEWPAADGPSITARKAPTQIAYVSGLVSKPWGYQVRPSGMDTCAWMKYHLDSEAADSAWDDPDLRREMKDGLLRISSSGGLVAEKVATEYLTEVLSFVVKQLERGYGKGVLSVTSISFWLTRPAVWGVQAVHKLKTAVEAAARNAKFPGARDQDEYGLIAEPEAAAFAIVTDPEYDIEDGIKEDSVVMVGDCGGGTVDITVHIVKRLSPVVELCELVPCQGAKCGAAYIDGRFESFMKGKFRMAYENVPKDERHFSSAFKRGFEENKRRFGSGDPLVPMKLRMRGVDRSDALLGEIYYHRDGEVMLTE